MRTFQLPENVPPSSSCLNFLPAELLFSGLNLLPLSFSGLDSLTPCPSFLFFSSYLLPGSSAPLFFWLFLLFLHLSPCRQHPLCELYSPHLSLPFLPLSSSSSGGFNSPQEERSIVVQLVSIQKCSSSVSPQICHILTHMYKHCIM